MAVCEFDGTETTLATCPTCNEYKGLNLAPLTVALHSVFEMMDEARAFAEENCDHKNDWCEHAVEDEEGDK